MGFMGMCSPKRVGFFSHIGYKQGMVLALWSGNIGQVSWKKLLFDNYQKDRHEKPIIVPAAKVINRESNFWPDHKQGGKNRRIKWGKSLWKWPAYPHPAFLGVSPGYNVTCTVIVHFCSMRFCQPLHMHKPKDDMRG